MADQVRDDLLGLLELQLLVVPHGPLQLGHLPPDVRVLALDSEDAGVAVVAPAVLRVLPSEQERPLGDQVLDDVAELLAVVGLEAVLDLVAFAADVHGYFPPEISTMVPVR